MQTFQLFAVTATGPQPLPVPTAAQDFTDLYTDVALGVYSIVRTFHHNHFLRLDYHLARTVNSMRLLGWDYQLDETRLRQAIHAVCTAFPAPEMRLRIDVLAQPATALGTASRELLALMPFTPLPTADYTQGVAVDFATGLHRTQPLVKKANFAQARKRSGIGTQSFDSLLLDEPGYILEGSSANFYGVRAGVIYTAGQGVLEGITRSIVLDLIRQLAIPLQLTAIHRTAIGELDEAFISSSSRGLLPVVQIGDKHIGAGVPGPYTRQLMAAYDTFVTNHIKPAI
ncbi:MAG: aminotransferase class IV [Caldilineaceae bacterium]|nr:aminotransferase class IV [Caldilineaceae bacterium]